MLRGHWEAAGREGPREGRQRNLQRGFPHAPSAGPPAGLVWQVGGTSRPQDHTGSRGSEQGDDPLSQARALPLSPTEPAR